jgi:hypothetical protein
MIFPQLAFLIHVPQVRFLPGAPIKQKVVGPIIITSSCGIQRINPIFIWPPTRVVRNTVMRIPFNKALHESHVISGCNFALIFDIQIDIL